MSRFRKPTDISQKPRDLQTDTAERLEAIVEAAERAAEGVIDDAEAQARRYLAQARSDADRLAVDRTEELSDVIASLLGQAITLREEAERLQVTLENASARLAGREVEPPGPAAAPVEHQPEHEAPRLRAVDADAAPAVEAEVGRANAAGARLLATQMAVSGNSREEIAERLRNGFEIEDTDAVLDAILGPEGR